MRPQCFGAMCLEGQPATLPNGQRYNFAGSHRRAADAHLEEAEEHGRVDAVGQGARADAAEHAGHAALQARGPHFGVLSSR